MKWLYYLALPIALIAGGTILLITDRQAPSSTGNSSATTSDITSPTAAAAGHTSTARSADGSNGHHDSLPQHSLTPATDKAAMAANENHDYSQSLQQRIEAMHSRRPGRSYDPEAVAQAVARKTAWKPVSEIPQTLPLTEEDRADGRQFIEFDPLKMETLMPGDEILVTVVEHGAEYRVRIDSVDIHDNGERISWHGHLTGLGEERFSATFTRGEFLTVGGMDTPEGHYVLQSHGEQGWIASSETLFKRNPDETDMIEPPQDGHDHS